MGYRLFDRHPIFMVLSYSHSIVAGGFDEMS